MNLVSSAWGCGRTATRDKQLSAESRGMSCWRTSKVFGQFPPRRLVREVARSLSSSWG